MENPISAGKFEPGQRLPERGESASRMIEDEGGFAVGVLIGVYFINKGFSLSKINDQNKFEGLVMPAINIVLLVILVAFPTLLIFSESGPGSMRAPIWIALIAGLVVGVLGNRSRICMVGGFRDMFLYKNAHLFIGTIGVLPKYRISLLFA